MRIATLIIATALSFGYFNVSAQGLKSLRGSWGVERNDNAGYKKQNYPAQDIYEEAMKLSSGSKGVKRDIYAAYEKYLEAADLGNPLAQHKVGACYYYGSGVEKNRKKAFQYWTKASEADIADAHYELGRLYYYGKNVNAITILLFPYSAKLKLQISPEPTICLGNAI